MGFSFFGSLFLRYRGALSDGQGRSRFPTDTQSGRKDYAIVACRRIFLHLLQRPTVSVRSVRSLFRTLSDPDRETADFIGNKKLPKNRAAFSMKEDSANAI